MHVIYSPENPADGERQEWEFDPKRIRAGAAEQIEKAFGGTWDEFEVAVQSGNTKARRVLLWHLMRQTHDRMQLRDVPDFYTGELEVQHTVPELLALRKRVEKMPADDAEREQMSKAFAMQIAEARERDGIPEEPDVTDGEVVDGQPGKALRRSRTSAAATG